MRTKIAVIMLISIVVLSISCSFAVSKFSDTIGTKYDLAVETLNNRKIVDGFEDGTFKPGNSVTRAQLCKLIVEGLKLKSVTDVALYKFTDIDPINKAWYYDYVKIAVDNNIIVGYPEGVFKPNKSVSFAEAFTMIIRAMGKESGMQDKTWPTAYINLATSLGLLKDVTYTDVNEAASRGETAISLYNMVLKLDAEKASSDEAQKKKDEEAKKAAAEKTPANFGIVDAVSEGKDDDYYVKVNGVKNKQQVVSFLGSKSYKYAKLEETEETVIGYNDTKNTDEIEILLNYKASDLDSAKSISSINGDVLTYTDKSTFDKSSTTNVDKYKYYTFIRITCSYEDDEEAKDAGEITFDKVEKLGTGLSSVKFAKAERTFIDNTNYVFVVVKGFGVNDTIKKGVVKFDSSSSSDNSDYVYGIVNSVSSSSKTDTVKIGKKTYDVSSKSKAFSEGALACYTLKSDEATLVRNISPSLLDNGSGIDIVSSVSGTKAGDQEVKFSEGTSTIDTSSSNSYKGYSFVTIEVSEDRNGEISIADFDYDNEGAISDIKFVKGDRVLIDKTNKIFAVFKGLSYSDSYKNGVNTDSASTTYTVTYTWSGSNPGVSPTPTNKKSIEAGDKYQIPEFTCSGYTITATIDGEDVELGSKITVNSNVKIVLKATKSNSTTTPAPTTTDTPTTPAPTTNCTVSYKWKNDTAPEGSSAKLPSSEQVPMDSEYTIKVPTNQDGYTFYSVDGDSIVVKEDKVVTIGYDKEEPTKYKVSYSWSGGSLSEITLPEMEEVDAGSKYKVETFELEGYEITTDPSGTITVDEDTTIKVSYVKNNSDSGE